ncbi:Serine/threonine-protein kinase hal4 [Zalerion maritima]|uniref:non-specific serine/threonine protein kinase n=1 Tax=Zalerion maritima TaxID=339359 RepID=A0AAD5RMS3_9PEZI|nr:Serine/threonine-protein kinase hal4 [Zalerion maritima]
MAPTSSSVADSNTSNASTKSGSSLQSFDLQAKASSSPRLSPQNGHVANGTIPAEHLPKPAEKSSMKGRLGRMFGATKEGANSKRPTPSPSPAPTQMNGNGSSPFIKPAAPPSRKGSVPHVPERMPSTKQPKSPPNFNRFILDAEIHGGHEHHLRSSRRQEKLSDLWRSLLGRKPESQEHPHAHDLSLVSSWVDALKKEKESLKDVNHDKKGGANSSVTLVEKYGKCQEVIGRGAFGIVRISHKRNENGNGEKLFAIKEFRRRPEETEKKYSKRLTAEFCISSSLRHPNVIHTLDLLKDAKGDFCEVMEFCAGGDLYTLVLSAGKLEVQEADCFFKQMMRGVEYMHEMGVAHRDLKPENLLLTTNGGLKITDFGNGECFRMAWENDAHMVSGLCGSAPYIAPEEYVDMEFDARAVDVWACGVIYMAMRTGRHLWRVAKKGEDEFYTRYLEGRRGEEGYGPIEVLHRARCRNVIYSILDPNPTRRLTASQILRSEWVREIKLCKAGEEGL